MVLTAESLHNFLDMLADEPLLPPEPFTLIMSPRMHKRIYLHRGMMYLTLHARRKLRKVHLCKIAKRCKEQRRRLERDYERGRRLPLTLRSLNPMS